MIKKIIDYIFGAKQEEGSSMPKAKILKLLIMPRATSDIIDPGEWCEVDTEGMDILAFYDQFKLDHFNISELLEAKRQIDEEIDKRNQHINEDEKCMAHNLRQAQEEKENGYVCSEMLQPPSLCICNKCARIVTRDAMKISLGEPTEDEPSEKSVQLHAAARAPLRHQELHDKVFGDDAPPFPEQWKQVYKICTHPYCNSFPAKCDCGAKKAINNISIGDTTSYKKEAPREKSSQKKKRIFPVRGKSHTMEAAQGKKK